MTEVLCHRYRLIERLGSGGMAVVWRGYDEVLGRQIAVKLLGPELASDPVFIERLRQEARAGAGLSHPNIMAVHDYGESVAEGGSVRPFVVMELLEGETLRSLLAEGRKLPWRKAVAIAAEVAAALAAAHARGIVHRDVSSGNVMLTPNGVKVLDFGISALIGEREPAHSNELLGTPAYVAPERLIGAEITPAVDIYALGVLLYRALSGVLPWTTETTSDLLEAHQWLSPQPLEPMVDLPPKVAQLCYRCLAKDPKDRPSSAELALVLGRMARVQVTLPPFASAETTAVTIGRLRTTVLPGRAFVPGAVAMPAVSGPDRTALLAPRGRIALTAVGVITALTAYFVLTVASRDTGTPAAAASCQVTYQQTSDSGGQFQAAVTVHNNGPNPVERWQLEFGWPGDQTVLAAVESTWDQQGRQVVIKPKQTHAALAAGDSHSFELAGQYKTLNALPAEFALTGTPCKSVVLGPSSRPPESTAAPQGVQTGSDDQGKGKDKGKGKGRGGSDDDDDDDDDD